MKKILITGANSYIGTSFAKYMTQWPQEYQVDTIDMIDGSWREKSFAGYDSVFHVAGIAHIGTRKLDELARERYWKVNALLPAEVALRAKAEGVGQFIFLSSMGVYGEHGSIKHPVVITRETRPTPKDTYGKSKLKAEEEVLSLNDEDFRVCVLRPPMIYGPRCKGNYRLLEKAALKLPIFPDLKNQRSMLFIDNLCAFVRIAINTNSFGILLPQNNEYICTSEMVRQIALVNGRKIRMTKVFNPLLWLLSGRIGVVDKVFGNLTYDISMSDYSIDYRVVDFHHSIVLSEV